MAEELAGGGVDDADVEVGDEQDDAGSGVGAADADVVEVAVDAQGDVVAGVDAVVADAVVGVGAAVAGAGYEALFAYYPDSDAILAFLVNRDGLGTGAADPTNILLEAINPLILGTS